ncbi:MAG: AraC family transcriptional regulator [Actinomycetia bacterium]|nr:AraC family transcriptional regulator [Actinomycetes bacterium]
MDTYREWAPPPAWRGPVTCLWEQRVSATRVQRVVPDGCADILFDSSGSVTVAGLHDEVDLPTLTAGTHIRGIRLRPQAVATVLGLPAHELRNRVEPLDAVTRRLDLTTSPPDRVGGALRLLARMTVGEAATTMGLSPRQLRRLLLAETGLGPKTFQRVLRLQRFLAHGGPLATAAVDAGYADQPHLTREVTRLCGLPPAALLAERASP